MYLSHAIMLCSLNGFCTNFALILLTCLAICVLCGILLYVHTAFITHLRVYVICECFSSLKPVDNIYNRMLAKKKKKEIENESELIVFCSL